MLARAKFAAPLQARGLSVQELFDGYAALATLVTPVEIPAVSRDPTDDAVLATALAAQALERIAAQR